MKFHDLLFIVFIVFLMILICTNRMIINQIFEVIDTQQETISRIIQTQEKILNRINEPSVIPKQFGLDFI